MSDAIAGRTDLPLPDRCFDSTGNGAVPGWHRTERISGIVRLFLSVEIMSNTPGCSCPEQPAMLADSWLLCWLLAGCYFQHGIWHIALKNNGIALGVLELTASKKIMVEKQPGTASHSPYGSP